MTIKLVESVNEAIINAKEFNSLEKTSSSNTLDVFANFSHWYYISDLDIFAPSKFIGYKETTLKNYNGAGKDGRETQKVLLQWFNPVDKKSQEFEKLKKKLTSYGNSIGKKINIKTLSEEGNGAIYLLKKEFTTTDYPDEVSYMDFPEGGKKTVTINAYERNPKARRKCISHYGATCYICNFDFSKTYGKELGAGFIHVHHIIELSSIKAKYKVDPIQDLRPLCPNCHAMVHRKNPAIHPDKLKEKLKA